MLRRRNEVFKTLDESGGGMHQELDAQVMSTSAVIGTFAAALLGSALGIFLVLPLGLIASELVIVPLAVGVAAVLSTLAASWTANFAAGDGSRTKIISALGITEAAAAALALIFLTSAALRVVLLGPVIYIAIVSTLVLALAATGAASRFRMQERSAKDGPLTLGLLALAVLSVPATIFIASLFGLTGA